MIASHNNSKLRKIAKVSVVVLATFTIGVLGFYVNFLRSENVHLETAHLANMVMDAAQNLQTPLPIDAQSGRVYIYEGRLTLPAQGPDTMMNYRYDKPSQSGDYDEEMRLTDVATFRTSTSGVRNAQTLDQLFSAIPHMQACGRGYRVLFKPNYDTESGPMLFSKKLKDGRTIYVYLEKDCDQSKSRIEPYIRQIESY